MKKEKKNNRKHILPFLNYNDIKPSITGSLYNPIQGFIQFFILVSALRSLRLYAKRNPMSKSFERFSQMTIT